MRIREELPDITNAPDEDMFALWQAVFAMVDVDGKITATEEIVLQMAEFYKQGENQ